MANACYPCSLDVHSDCRRHEGEPCGCQVGDFCGVKVRVFTATPEPSNHRAQEMVAAAIADRQEVFEEVERLRAALTEIAGCPNEGPFLRRIAREALEVQQSPPSSPPACPGEHTVGTLGNLVWIECDGETIARRTFPLPARNDERSAWVEAELVAHGRPGADRG